MTVSAVFENGVFRPEQPIALSQGTRVDVIVPEILDPVARLRALHPDSFGVLGHEAAREMREAIEEAFEKVDPDAWS